MITNYRRYIVHKIVYTIVRSNVDLFWNKMSHSDECVKVSFLSLVSLTKASPY